jgi:hypothetical protein
MKMPTLMTNSNECLNASVVMSYKRKGTPLECMKKGLIGDRESITVISSNSPAYGSWNLIDSCFWSCYLNQ